MHIDYVKYNSYRKKEFAIKTVVYSDDAGVKSVKKIPMYTEAGNFLACLAENYEALSLHYASVKPCQYKADENNTSFPYVQG